MTMGTDSSVLLWKHTRTLDRHRGSAALYLRKKILVASNRINHDLGCFICYEIR